MSLAFDFSDQSDKQDGDGERRGKVHGRQFKGSYFLVRQ